MLFDAENLFSDDQAVTADAASTNIIDTGAAKDAALGRPVEINVQVTEAFNTLTSLGIQVQTATDEAFTTPVVLATETIALADLVVGKRFSLRYLPEGCLRYVRLYYDVTGVAPTTGKIHAGIVEGGQTNVHG